MAIYDFSKAEKSELDSSALSTRCDSEEQPSATKRSQTFSAVAARLFFLLLLSANALWVVYALLKMIFSVIGFSVTGGRIPYFNTLNEKAWVALRRSLICGVSLAIALFSPAFGIMIACTYFLMYDKAGIEEVVPSSLQSQFKEFLPKE